MFSQYTLLKPIEIHGILHDKLSGMSEVALAEKYDRPLVLIRRIIREENGLPNKMGKHIIGHLKERLTPGWGFYDPREEMSALLAQPLNFQQMFEIGMLAFRACLAIHNLRPLPKDDVG